MAEAVLRVALAGRDQRHREVLVGLDYGIAADINGDGLARLAGGKADRASGQSAAKVRGIGRVCAAAGQCIGRARGGGEIATAGDREGKRGATAVAFEFKRILRGNGQCGRWQNVIVLDCAGSSGGGDRGIGRSAER